MRINGLFVLATLATVVSAASADLINEFAGFSTIWETGVSGLRSSYDVDTVAAMPVNGPTTSTMLPVLGPGRVSYPGGVGEVPSPGGTLGQHFDEGVLGVQVVGNNLVFKLADGLDPQTGYYHHGWESWYGQGDLFVTVADSSGIRHYALLNSWARGEGATPIRLDDGLFDATQAFHLAGGSGETSLEGHLVRLVSDADVALTGGVGSYHSGNSPAGLDLRAYAQSGTDLRDAGLTHTSLTDLGQPWYIQTWTIPVSDLSTETAFGMSLHGTVSCGNDQIGGSFNVPEPSSLALVLAGLGLSARFRRNR